MKEWKRLNCEKLSRKRISRGFLPRKKPENKVHWQEAFVTPSLWAILANATLRFKLAPLGNHACNQAV
jgi:hypothetical protein